jgi:hypothetical protein
LLYYINKPVAAEEVPTMGAKALFAVNATLGGKKPLSVAAISSFAEALGVAVPIPVCANACVAKYAIKKVNKINAFNFMFF